MANKFDVKITAEGPGGRIATGDAAVRLIEQQIQKAVGDRRECARRIIHKYALLIQGDARKNLNRSPRRIDTGHLRTSIQTQISGMLDARLSAMIHTNLPHAFYVHWGTGIYGQAPEGGHRKTPWVYYDEKRKTYVFTHGMRPNKFLLDAYTKHEKNYLMELQKCLLAGS